MSGWIDDQRRTVADVAHALGREGSNRQGFPCPACGEEKRDGRRGAVFVGRDGAWKCYRCDAVGDGLDYLSYALTGRRLREASAEQRQTVREWCGGSSGQSVPAPPRPPPRAPRYADVSAFWTACGPCPSGDPFLRDRRLVAPPHLARFTPDDTTRYPEWWPAGRAKVWRLVTRGWRFDTDDRNPVPVNLHGRAVVEPPEFDGRRIKTLWAKGLDSHGLLFWNQRPAASADIVLVAEGLTDWLAAACWADDKPGVTVFGLTSGGPAAFAHIEIAASARLILATDDDAAGDAYASAVLSHYPGRAIYRAHPSRFPSSLPQQDAAK